jgi:starch phosphorylase
MRRIKQVNKEHFADVVLRRVGVEISVDSLFDVQVKRIHEYKRQLLNLLYVITRYNRLRRDPQSVAVARTVVFAGKAAPGYVMAKAIIKLINNVARVVNEDRTIGDKLRVRIPARLRCHAGAAHHARGGSLAADLDGRHGGLGPPAT